MAEHVICTDFNFAFYQNIHKSTSFNSKKRSLRSLHKMTHKNPAGCKTYLKTVTTMTFPYAAGVLEIPRTLPVQPQRQTNKVYASVNHAY